MAFTPDVIVTLILAMSTRFLVFFEKDFTNHFPARSFLALRKRLTPKYNTSVSGNTSHQLRAQREDTGTSC
jgi:hypothetical protein